MKDSSNVVCIISCGDGMYDNKYTFFEDGRVFREYDKNNFQFNLERWYNGKDINGTAREKILNKCTPEKLQIVTDILDGKV